MYKAGLLNPETDKIRLSSGGKVILTNATATTSGKGYLYKDGAYESAGSCSVFKFQMQDYLDTAGSKFKKYEDLANSACMHPVTRRGVGINPLNINYTLASFKSDPRYEGLKCNTCYDYHTDPCKMDLRTYFINKMDEMNLDAVVYLVRTYYLWQETRLKQLAASGTVRSKSTCSW